MKGYHELKTHPEYYKKILSGEKKFEIRKMIGLLLLVIL